MSRPKFDLIKTIDDDEDVPDFSEHSDEEEAFQPTKQKIKKKADFSTDFEFVSSVKEYNQDTWDDLTKFIKRKANNKVDDKIEAHRKQRKIKETNSRGKKQDDGSGSQSGDESEEENMDVDSGEEDNADSDMSLSEDELKKDTINLKERSVKRAEKLKKQGASSGSLTVEAEKPDEEDEDFFEDAPPFDESTTFNQMNISRPLLKAIGALNFVHPTPIQAATVPMALLGRDICGCAATGTGKTAAYMLPILERLLYRPQASSITRVLVLVPTRELGVQVYQVTKQLAQFTSIEVGLSVGGLDVKAQEAVLRKNPDIVIATPGRLIDHIRNTPSFALDSIEVLVLDEADRMLDENFSEQMKEIVRQTARTRQTMLFSATMTDQVEDLAAVSLKKPVRIFVDNNSQVALNLRQEFVRIRRGNERDREAILAALVCRTFRDHTMIFVTTKRQAHWVHLLLGLLGVKIGELHGDMTQPQRLEALRKFKNEELDVLVATDVAARGLDIRGVKTVINFMMPATLEHYIHRVGRTARAGRGGVSVSLAGENDRKIVRDVIKNATNPVKSRVIPPEIILKYRKKCEALADDIKAILEEEFQERQLLKLENQTNRAQKMLNGEQPQKRDWFQSKKEREVEKDRLRLTEVEKTAKRKKNPKEKDEMASEKDKKPKKKKKTVADDTPEGRMAKEMEKVALLQARMAKRKCKPKKISKVYDKDLGGKNGSAKKKKSSFSTDLTDTSLKGVKRIRYEANSKKKMDQIQKRKSSGVNKNTKSFNAKMGKSGKGGKPGKKAFGAKKR